MHENNNKYAPIIILIVLVAGFFAFSVMRQGSSKPVNPEPSQDQTVQNETTAPETSTETTITESTSPTDNSLTQTDANTKSFTVTASNFKFDPKEIRVKKGDIVKLTVTNAGGFHDFVIDEFNAKTKQLAEGESETITFVADKAGQFQYYCSVGQHRAMGMVGTLFVE